MEKPTILAIDDHATARQFYKSCLESDYDVELAASGLEGLKIVRERKFDLYLLDLMMPGMNGVECIRELRKIHTDAPVLVVSQTEDIDLTVKAFKEDLVDFFRKPVQRELLLHAIRKNLQFKGIQTGLNRMQKESANDFQCPDPVLGPSDRMREFWNQIKQIAASQIRAAVLLTGESGTGKEVASRQLHRLSDRSRGPFIAVNCALLNGQLAASELFGIEKGVATGVTERTGKFMLADKGTLFLDEVAELSLEVQAALLRVIQDQKVMPMGARKAKQVDVSIISATNKNLQHLMTEGKFREDLFYRLAPIQLHIPSLRDHAEDVPALLEFLYRRRGGTGPLPLSPQEIAHWQQLPWPGNIRELENALINRVILNQPPTGPNPPQSVANLDLDDIFNRLLEQFSFKEIRQQIYKFALQQCGGNIRQTAGRLGISPAAVHDFVKHQRQN